jgi:hypothetical protein
MTEPIKIDNWEVVVSLSESGYSYPPAGVRKLAGTLVDDTVYRHRVRPAGQEIVTSPIQSSNGRIVHTVNSTYELVGAPSASYAKWCSDNGIAIDADQPIKILR